MDPQAPSVGRIVRYVSHGTPPREDGSQAHPSKTRAAVITEVHGPTEVGLAVFNPSGFFFDQHVMQDETGTAPGTWHWPAWVMAA
ncbi:hypothetical protein [Streptomyces sp. NPDC059916]|uniref:hypothetical protein n=1 Tax=Streptomyces sp. NPDC059916 TaxID=3347001 RepID=UPI0036849D57